MSAFLFIIIIVALKGDEEELIDLIHYLLTS